MKTLQFKESIFMALGALKANKLRAFLTLLGVIIGVFSFIGVMTGISVLQDTIESSFNVLGSNTLVVQKYPAMSHGPDDRMKYRNRKDITIEEGEYVRANSRLASAVTINVSSGGAVIEYGSKHTNPDVGVEGGTPEIAQTENRTLSDGRMYNEHESQTGKPVAVVGMGVVKLLFPNENPLGKRIRVDGHEVMIIGVVAEKGGMFGEGADNFVLLPLTTFSNFFGKARWASIEAQARNQATYDAMTDEIIGLLRTVRRVPPGAENDFEIISNESLISSVNDVTYYIRLGTGAVSAIALLAAGIGIMNIMLVSVSERTREIGIRKALGARKATILAQFLVEAVVICQLGGLIGIFLGLGGGNIVAILLKIPPVMPVGWALFGLFVTTTIGVIFGVYPAWKAANLDPIEALRYE
jgi:putative ABC transport system permease protein